MVNLSLDEGVVTIRCMSDDVRMSDVEALPAGGTRLTCIDSAAADLIRRKLTRYVGDDIVVPARYPR